MPSVENFKVTLTAVHYKAGDTLQGIVSFGVLPQSADGTGLPFARISLKVKGFEQTWLGDSDHRQSSSRYFGESQTSNFYKKHITLLGEAKIPKRGRQELLTVNAIANISPSVAREPSVWSGVLPVGQYVFPFAIKLPADSNILLPSIMAGGAVGDRCTVEYTVTAQINLAFQTGQSNSTSAGFFIYRPMPLRQVKASTPIVCGSSPLSVSHTTCCCIGSGKSLLKYSVDKNIVVMGQDSALSGSIEIDNSHSGTELSEVTVSLIERTSYRCVSSVRSVERRVGMTFIGTKVAAKLKSPVTIPFSIGLSGSEFVSVARGSYAGHRAPEFRGNLIKNEYQLVFRFAEEAILALPFMLACAIDDTDSVPFIGAAFSDPPPALPGGAYDQFLYKPPTDLAIVGVADHEEVSSVAILSKERLSPPLSSSAFAGGDEEAQSDCESVGGDDFTEMQHLPQPPHSPKIPLRALPPLTLPAAVGDRLGPFASNGRNVPFI